jgi:hypothetical protein
MFIGPSEPNPVPVLFQSISYFLTIVALYSGLLGHKPYCLAAADTSRMVYPHALGVINGATNSAAHRVKATIANNLAFTSAHLLPHRTPFRLGYSLGKLFLKLFGTFLYNYKISVRQAPINPQALDTMVLNSNKI